MATSEAAAMGEAVALLDAVVAEKSRVLELLGTKEAETAAASKKVAEFEGVVVKLEGEEHRAACGERRIGKAIVGDADLGFPHPDSKGKGGGKLQGVQLESEVEASKTELAAVRRGAFKLRFEVAEADKNHSLVAAEADGLRIEIDRMMKTNEVAAAAFDDEKTELERELEGLKRKVGRIQAEKDAAMGMVHEKDAEAAKLRAALERLHNSMAGLRVLCDELSDNSSCFQHEKDSVLKLLNQERAKAGKLKLRIGELESSNGEKDHEIGALKTEVEDKGSQINVFNGGA